MRGITVLVLALTCGLAAHGAEQPREKKPVAKKTTNPAPGLKPTAVAAPYVHVVLFKLTADAPSNAADELLADCHRLLGKIPSVRVLKAGKPAAYDSKDFVQKDYDVALTILFDDFLGLKEYLDHKLHVQFVEKHLPCLDKSRLRVFDFVDGK